jgi:hypothetical protein
MESTCDILNITRGKNLEEARTMVLEYRSVSVADTAQKLNINQG